MSQSMNASKAWLPAFEGAKAEDGVTTSVAPESTSTGLGDAVGDWRPVSVGAQRLELLAKMIGIRFKKAVRRTLSRTPIHFKYRIKETFKCI